MRQVLLSLSIGPVQPFIAAARRTRDLWFGSQVLSEISLAAAKGLQACSVEPGVSVELIFPLSTADASQGVSNKVLALLTGEIDAAVAARRARLAAENCWNEFCASALAIVGDRIDREIWDSQQQGVLEFFAAWCEVAEDDGGYARARDEVDEVLRARKALRDFGAGQGYARVPKSSLDGARESVCRFDGPSARRSDRIRGVRPNEHLDLVGIVKRVGQTEQSHTFPSVTQVAADPWIRGLFRASGQSSSRLQDLQHVMRRSGLPFSRVDVEQYPMYRDFYMDASILFPSRANQVFDDLMDRSNLSLDQDEMRKVTAALADFRHSLSRDSLSSNEPYPYLACVSADGDHMGQYVSSLTTLEAHREVSAQLSAFSSAVRETVPRYRGVCVYAGGDDVLAFAPLDQCLDLARELRSTFVQIVGAGAAHPSPCTLSVGVAIAHCLEPLEDILALTRQAEKAAKHPDRDGLAVSVQTRGGGEAIITRSRWERDPDQSIRRFAVLFYAGLLPSGLPYELRQLMFIYQRWESESGSAVVDLVRSDMKRLLSRKRSSIGEPLSVKDQELWIESIRRVCDVSTLCGQMIVAQHIAFAMRQSGEVVSVGR